MNNNMPDATTQKPKQGLSFLVIAGIVVIGLGLVGWYKLQKAAQGPVQNTSASRQQNTPQGSMWLESIHNKKIYTAGESITLMLYADSDKQSINGYDALIPLGKQTAFVEVKNLEEALSLKSRKYEDSLVLTAVTPLEEAANGVVLAGSPLAQITLRSQIPGPLDVALQFKKEETSDSNIVRVSPPEDILAQVRGVIVYIGSRTKLKSNQPMSIRTKDSMLDVSIKNVALPDSACRDCQTQVTITFKKGSQSTDYTFSLGGLEGKLSDMTEIFGHVFEVTAITADSVELAYASTSTNEKK